MASTNATGLGQLFGVSEEDMLDFVFVDGIAFSGHDPVSQMFEDPDVPSPAGVWANFG